MASTATGSRPRAVSLGVGAAGRFISGQYIEPVRAPALPLLPGPCALCRGWSRSRLCPNCLARHAPPVARCRRCALEVPPGRDECGACLHAPPPFERSIAALDYVPPWTALIARFKFHAALDLAGPLAERLVRACRDAGTSAALILPVPLGAQRLRERGYNQAWEIARRVAAATDTRADAQLLLRIRETPHQLALPLAERAANVRGVFAVEPRRRAEVAGRHVAIVDDVMTSGATAAEIARVLLAAQAASVQVWAIARTPRPHDG